MGFFTLEIARQIGPRGRVVAVDIQPEMLAGLERRAKRAGLDHRIECRLGVGAELGVGDLQGAVDFVLAYAVVHELPDTRVFFRETASALKKDGQLLFAEPLGAVDEALFAQELRTAIEAGFSVEGLPAIGRSRAALLKKK
jgi:ubiquinone/menaquinone biosynthesis C-methylase UbiE